METKVPMLRESQIPLQHADNPTDKAQWRRQTKLCLFPKESRDGGGEATARGRSGSITAGPALYTPLCSRCRRGHIELAREEARCQPTMFTPEIKGPGKPGLTE